MNVPHISVCICTFKRPTLLTYLLTRLEDQRTDGLFTYGAVVADNDGARSAEHAVAGYAAISRVPITYCAEPQQNIALARNRAVQHAHGDFIAFIDDDEFPAEDWLLTLFKACVSYGADGILGPVKPHFESAPPEWVKKGGFFDRPMYATGYRLTWAQSRSGNVLFRRDILKDVDVPFRPQFATAGEDMDFFRRMMEKGRTFLWCNEAVAYESVPIARCTRSYLLRRAVLRGSNFPKHPTGRLKSAATSLIAAPCYALALPILALFGQHVFVRYLIKFLDHSSRLLAFMGLSLLTERQT